MTDLPGRDLIDGNAKLQPGPHRLPGVAAGEERRAGPGMVAGAVSPVVGGVMGQPGDDLEAPLQVRHRGERFVELVVLPFSLGGPALVVAAVRKADERCPQRHPAGGRGERTGWILRRGEQRFQARQRDAYPQPAEKGAAGRMEKGLAHLKSPRVAEFVRIQSFFLGTGSRSPFLWAGGARFGASGAGRAGPTESPASPRRVWNGGLSTIAARSTENLPPSVASRAVIRSTVTASVGSSPRPSA